MLPQPPKPTVIALEYPEEKPKTPAEKAAKLFEIVRALKDSPFLDFVIQEAKERGEV